MSRVALLHSRLTGAGLAAGVALLAGSPALAQSSSCQDANKFLTERKSIVEQLNKLSSGGKKLDPRSACTVFTKLVSNGETGVKWIESNKDWCQIPDQFAEGFKQDHTKAVSLKSQACQAAAKLTELEKKARAQAQQGGPGLLGGGGLTGEYKIPQGAL